jgi:hypothetical protein
MCILQFPIQQSQLKELYELDEEIVLWAKTLKQFVKVNVDHMTPEGRRDILLTGERPEFR